jgi:hypothetical protein
VRLAPLLDIAAAAACRSEAARPAGGGAGCGIAALAGPVTLLSQFAVPRQTLSEAPSALPERIPVRLVAGPVLPGVVGRTKGEGDSTLVIGVDGSFPGNPQPQFGVLVVDPKGAARGVLLYESAPVEGAPHLGSVSLGPRAVPLVGIQLDPAKFEDPKCPFFPASAAQ